MTTSPKEIRAAITRVQTLLTNAARLEASFENHLTKHDGSLDAKTLDEVARIQAGLALAGPSITRMRASMAELLNAGCQRAADQLRARIDVLHMEIDQAIGERVIKSAPEDIRAGINVTATKPWQDEQSARRKDFESVSYIHPQDGMPRIIEAAEAAITVITSLEAELARASAAGKKLGVAA